MEINFDDEKFVKIVENFHKVYLYNKTQKYSIKSFDTFTILKAKVTKIKKCRNLSVGVIRRENKREK